MKIEIESWGRWKIAWVNSASISAAIKLVDAGEVDGFGLSPFKGFRSADLSFVFGVKKLKGLVIPSFQAQDMTCLSALTSLQFLSLGEFKAVPDLSEFGQLEHLQMVWNAKTHLPPSDGLLEKLYLYKFAPKTGALLQLSSYKAISDLRLIKSSITTLEGIVTMPRLANAEFHYLSKLKSIKGLRGSGVERLTFTHCPHIEDVAALAECPKLKALHYHDSAPIRSLGFIRASKSLRSFRFVGVDVIDGDMSPLLALSEIAFTDKRNFSHKEKDVQRAIGMAK